METIKEAEMCKECNGAGGGYANYTNSDHNVEMGTGDWEKCENCNGTGIESDEDIIVERIVENLTKNQEEKLQAVCFESNPMVLDDDMPDAFEAWLSNRTLSDFKKILYA